MKQATAVCELVQNRPNEELNSLTNQVGRAAVSVPADVAEGLGCGTVREEDRFVRIALGPLCELNTALQLASDVGCGSKDGAVGLRERLFASARRTSSLISYRGDCT